MKKFLLTFSSLLSVIIATHSVCAQFESGGFGGFQIQMMNFGSAGFGIANGGSGGATFGESGFIGGFGYGGAVTRQNKTVSMGYGGILGGARIDLGDNHKAAFGARIGLGALAKVEIDENNNQVISNSNFVRLEPNAIYGYELISNFHLLLQVGYSFNLVGNLQNYDTPYFSVGFILGMF